MKIPMRRIARFFDRDARELMFSRGDGPYVFDSLDRRYIDFVLGFGPVVLGHGRSDFNGYVAELTRTGIHFPSYGTLHGKLVDLMFGRDTDDLAVSFHKTSSEAVTAAFRLAAAATGKKGILRCGFTGWHDAQIAASPRWHEPPSSPLRSRIRTINNLRGVSGSEEVFNWTDLRLESLAAIIENYSDTIGVFAIDAYQCSLADWPLILEAIALCKKSGMRVIFDETKTAGRVGPLGLWGNHDIPFDYVVMGKAIANGAPLSLLVMRETDIENFYQCRVGGTFSKEITGIAAAIATYNVMASSNGYVRLCAIGQSLVRAINLAALDVGVERVFQAVGRFGGTMFDLLLDPALLDNGMQRSSLSTALADNGLLVLQGHPSFVCLDHSRLDLDDVRHRFGVALRAWSTTH